MSKPRIDRKKLLKMFKTIKIIPSVDMGYDWTPYLIVSYKQYNALIKKTKKESAK
jgi:hypothetical protein